MEDDRFVWFDPAAPHALGIAAPVQALIEMTLTPALSPSGERGKKSSFSPTGERGKKSSFSPGGERGNKPSFSPGGKRGKKSSSLALEAELLFPLPLAGEG